MSLQQAVFSIVGVNAVDQVLFNLKAPATIRPRIMEVGIFLEVLPTNVPQYGLKRMNAVGTGAITNATICLDDPADTAALAALETAWATTRPTVTGGSARRTQVPLALGNGIIWDFRNQRFLAPASGGLCGVILNASGATVGTHGGYVIWEE